MTDSVFKLKNAPIVEAVIDIECDLPPALNLLSLEAEANKVLGKSYPKFKRQYVQEHRIEAKVDEPPSFSVKGGLQGLQFLHDDEKQVVQFRGQGFSFNRLNPYTSLDDYLPQIKRAWLAYDKLASPVQIRLIRLRYINRILLPLVNARVDVDQYFRNRPKLADEERLTLLGFLNQYSALDNETGNQVNIVLTAQAPENDKLPVIFDNSASALDVIEPGDWSSIRSKILELRRLKNHLFRSTLTEKCLNLFQ